MAPDHKNQIRDPCSSLVHPMNGAAMLSVSQC